MKIFTSRPAIALATAAALSMTATPAFADGWGRHRHRHHNVDAGDIFAGILVIGGIAAIAAAASNANKDRRERYSRYPEPDYRNPRPDYREPSGRYGGYPEQRDGRDSYGGSSSDISEAVDRCIGEVERGERRVDGVDSVWRDGEGWRVDGRMDDGRDFSCTVDRDGRINKVTVGGQAA